MRNAHVLSVVVLLIVLMPITFQTGKAQQLPNGEYFPPMGPLTIVSPTNSTYLSASTLLNIDYRTMSSPKFYDYKICYSLDGKDNTSITVTCFYDPLVEKLWTQNGITTRGPFSIAPNYRVTAMAALPTLPEGPHNLTVYARYERINNENPNWPTLVLDNQMVNFTVNYEIPPALTNLSVENKTYLEQTLPLNFTTDKTASWMGYSLDGNANITITGNSTLTGIASGAHNLTVYAKDLLVLWNYEFQHSDATAGSFTSDNKQN